VLGKTRYFGKIEEDPTGQTALALWCNRKNDLLAGREPRDTGEGLTVKDLCDRFLTNREDKMADGELTAISFYDYHATCKRIVKAFGLRRLVVDLDAADFEQFRRQLAKGRSSVTLANDVRRVRVVFRYAEQNNLIPISVR
jgi:hypothetical protein